MMQHFFVAPDDVLSPRWKEAFADAVLTSASPALVNSSMCLWMFFSATQRKADIASITALTKLGAKVVVMTDSESTEQAFTAIAAGASAYIHYLATPLVFRRVAASIESGGLWLGTDLMSTLIQSTAKIVASLPVPTTAISTLDPARLTSSISGLTDRERAVAEAVAAGKNNKEIAQDLVITERTVKAHLSAAFKKLKVRDRLQLVLMLSDRRQT
jgi:two-component system, NarL family, nitrate/nitrite response regulator NarL